MIKTFRGQLAGGGQDRIRLQTIKGKVGYRIVKLQIMQKSPGTVDNVGLVTLWKDAPTTAEIAATTWDLSNSSILGIALYSGDAQAHFYPNEMIIIFDNEVFNQDIYITYVDVASTGPHNDPMNYYIELEVIPLDDAGAEYTTLKDMRQA